MSVRFRTFRNRTRKPVSLLIGAGYLVDAGEEVILPSDEAQEALELYGDLLEEITIGSIGHTVADERPEIVWVANMTGDPDAPAEIKVGFKRDPLTGNEVSSIRKNPLAKPTPFLYRYRDAKPPRVHVHDEKGIRWQEGVPLHKMVIKPFQRIPLGYKLAQNLLSKREVRTGLTADWVIKARPEGSVFEPKPNWSLDGLRTWLFQVERDHEICGPSEAQIRKAHSNRKDAEMDIERQRLDLWKKCWLRMVNPAKTVPTESQWEKFAALDSTSRALALTTEESEKIVEAQLKQAPPKKKRGPGRPRKHDDAAIA